MHRTFGTEAYLYSSLGKLAANTVKALRTVANDDLRGKSLSLYNKFQHKQNEEMYMAEFIAIQPGEVLFRLHWNRNCGILSISYVESPLENVQRALIDSARTYIKDLTVRSQTTLLSNELLLFTGLRDIDESVYTAQQLNL